MVYKTEYHVKSMRNVSQDFVCEEFALLQTFQLSIGAQMEENVFPVFVLAEDAHNKA